MGFVATVEVFRQQLGTGPSHPKRGHVSQRVTDDSAPRGEDDSKRTMSSRMGHCCKELDKIFHSTLWGPKPRPKVGKKSYFDRLVWPKMIQK